jgi:Domain of unknown function (DUF4129)
MRGRAIAVALPALVVLALIAVVAVAATGSTPSGSSASRPPSKLLLDAVFTLYLVAIVAGGVLLVYGLTQRKAIAREVATGRYRRFSLVSLLVLAVFTALTYRGLRGWKPPASPDEIGDPAFPGQAPFPTTPEQEQLVPYQPSVAWLPIVLVVGLVVAAVFAYVVADRRARRRDRPEGVLAKQLALILDDTLDDLRAEADPRRAIIAAYARLEQVLAANGVARRPAETSEEYLQRILTGLTLHSRAAERLTALFTQAKFSHHHLDATMKEEAISALEQVRDELRRARDETPRPIEPSAVLGSAP